MASGDTIAIFTPLHNEPPSASAATLDTRNQHPVVDHDAATNESAVFTSVMPRNFGSSAGITPYISFAMSTATSGCVDLQIAFERIGSDNLDIDSDSFASACTLADVGVPGTAGCVLTASLAMSNTEADGVQAGEAFRCKFTRRGTTDGATGDLELVTLELKET